MFGTPPVRALFYEFPDEQELFNVDLQWMVGGDILVTPVMTPNVSTVDGVCYWLCIFSLNCTVLDTVYSGIFPGRGTVTWRDWYTHEVLNATSGGATTLSAPLGHIPVHIRSGAVILLHSQPGYTTNETLQSPYTLFVSLSSDGSAFGSTYIDDGTTLPTENVSVSNRTISFSVTDGTLTITSQGDWQVAQNLDTVTVLGVDGEPSAVSVGCMNLTSQSTYESGLQRLNVSSLGLDLNAEGPTVLAWN